MAGLYFRVTELAELERDIHGCESCPRLAAFLRECRAERPEYWARPVAGFGDPDARVFILGLAPGYHGANRHGRVFTGDDSGRWLYGALYELGVCSEPNSTGRAQPLTVPGVWISNAVRCVPPGNRPTGEELRTCRDYLAREMALLPRVSVVVALGHLAHQSYLRARGLTAAHFPFGHSRVHQLPSAPELLVDSYHPSRQNTNTGVLTRAMWIEVLDRALLLASFPQQDADAGRTRSIPEGAGGVRIGGAIHGDAAVRRPPAVDVESGSVDESRFPTGQEHGRTTDLV